MTIVQRAERCAGEVQRHAHQHDRPHSEVADDGIELGAGDRCHAAHPQITLENAPDTVHFQYVHGATVTPRLLHWEVDGPFYKGIGGLPIPTADGGERIALKNHTIAPWASAGRTPSPRARTTTG